MERETRQFPALYDLLSYVSHLPKPIDLVPSPGESLLGIAAIFLIFWGALGQYFLQFDRLASVSLCTIVLSVCLTLSAIILYSTRTSAVKNRCDEGSLATARIIGVSERMIRYLRNDNLEEIIGYVTVQVLEDAAENWLRAMNALRGEYLKRYISAEPASEGINILSSLDSVAMELVGHFRQNFKDKWSHPIPVGRYPYSRKLVSAGVHGRQMPHPAEREIEITSIKLAALADEIDSFNHALSSPRTSFAQTTIDRSIQELQELKLSGSAPPFAP